MPATLYDYRQPQRSRKGTKPKKPIYARTSHQAGQRRPAQTAHIQGGHQWWRTLGFITLALVVVILCLFFLARMALPLILPLDRDLTIVFIPTGPIVASEAVVVAFKPSNTSLVAAKITDADTDQWPSGEVIMNPTAWSLALGQVVDQVKMIPVDASLAQANQVGGVLWSDLNHSDNLTQQIDTARLWSFTQTVPGSHQRWLEPSTPTEWQRAKIQLKAGAQFTQCPVGVINTTNTSGLAGRYSAIVEQTGFPVVRLSDNQDKSPVTLIVFEPSRPECQIEAERLTALFDPAPQLRADADLVKRHRAEIVILVGQDATASAQLEKE